MTLRRKAYKTKLCQYGVKVIPNVEGGPKFTCQEPRPCPYHDIGGRPEVEP